MVRTQNHIGTIEISNAFFALLIGKTVTDCFGVAGMNLCPSQGLKRLVKGRDFVDKGVRVSMKRGRLVVDLHITVTYGLNISVIVKSIVHKVRYAVEDATGVTVAKVNVHVDDMKF